LADALVDGQRLPLLNVVKAFGGPQNGVLATTTTSRLPA